MKKTLLYILSVVSVAAVFSSCLKNHDGYEDFADLPPTADIPKATANAAAPTTALPTNSWFVLDSAAGTVNYLTAVHLSAANHVGNATVKMMIDNAAGAAWIASHAGYTLLPADLYTVPTLDVVIPNAGVFSTGDFAVQIKANANNGAGVSRFKGMKFILPISIQDASPYGISANFKTILWYIQVKLK